MKELIESVEQVRTAVVTTKMKLSTNILDNIGIQRRFNKNINELYSSDIPLHDNN